MGLFYVNLYSCFGLPYNTAHFGNMQEDYRHPDTPWIRPCAEKQKNSFSFTHNIKLGNVSIDHKHQQIDHFVDSRPQRVITLSLASIIKHFPKNTKAMTKCCFIVGPAWIVVQHHRTLAQFPVFSGLLS